MSTRDTDSPPTHTGEPTIQLPPKAHVFGEYRATLEFTTQSGAPVFGHVTVEGSALVVEQVISAAADAFRGDAER